MCALKKYTEYNNCEQLQCNISPGDNKKGVKLDI